MFHGIGAVIGRRDARRRLIGVAHDAASQQALRLGRGRVVIGQEEFGGVACERLGAAVRFGVVLTRTTRYTCIKYMYIIIYAYIYLYLPALQMIFPFFEQESIIFIQLGTICQLTKSYKISKVKNIYTYLHQLSGVYKSTT